MKVWTLLLAVLLVSTARAEADRPAHPEKITHRITGLCCRDREPDLRDAVAKIPGVELVSIDFEKAEATFLYDPVRLFPNDRPDRHVEVFENLLKTASNHTFGIKPTPASPPETLTLVEIPVVGLDCKGCCLGTYNAVYQIAGVERATACSKLGRVTALIDPAKTNREALEASLKRANVTLKTP